MFYLRYEICIKQDDAYKFKANFSYKNKNGVNNSVGKVCSLSACGDRIVSKGNKTKLKVSFKEIYEIKLYIGTKRGVDFLIPDECISFNCIGVSEKNMSFAID